MTTLVTRAQWGAAPPVNVSHNVDPTGGVAIHHVGVGSYAYADHARCLTLVKAIQRMHMANTTEKYVDIAYNLLACQHDYIFEGRSKASDPKVRPGSNGTAQANTVAMSICCLWGDGDGEPNQGMLNAAAGGVAWLRENADAGSRVSGHRDWSSTSCPGHLYPKLGTIKALADNPPTPKPPPAPVEPPEAIPAMILAEHATNTGVWYLVGPSSAIHVDDDERSILESMGVPVSKAKISTPLVRKLRLPGEAERP
jgi:hypothetical protein